MAGSSEIHANHRNRMRYRVRKDGVTSLADHELLEFFLFDVIPRRNTNITAHLLLDKFGSLDKVFSASVSELMEVEGIGEVTAGYIADSYAEFQDECEKELLSRPLRSFEHVSNYLIFHRLRHNSAYTVILMNCEMATVRVVDAESAEEVFAFDGESEKVIVAAHPEKISEIVSFAPTKSELVDVLTVDGFTVESVLKFPE